MKVLISLIIITTITSNKVVGKFKWNDRFLKFNLKKAMEKIYSSEDELK